MLKRKIQKVIQDYYRLGSNKVLLLDGARQIGKSYIIISVILLEFNLFLIIKKPMNMKLKFSNLKHMVVGIKV